MSTRNPIPSEPWTLNVRIPRRRKGHYADFARKSGRKLLPMMWEELDRVTGFTPCPRCGETGVMADGLPCKCNEAVIEPPSNPR